MIGAGALTVASARFGSAPAEARASCQCCDLAHCPANVSYDYCYAHSAYVWECSNSAFNYCLCCETSGYTGSALRCYESG